VCPVNVEETASGVKRLATGTIHRTRSACGSPNREKFALGG